MRHTSLLLGSFVVLATLTSVGCDDGGNTGGAGGTASSTTGSSKSSSGSGMTTTSTTSTTSAASTTNTTTADASSSSTGSGMSMFSHLVISEVVVGPTNAEFIEIYNPTANAVDLTNYYISDNHNYFQISNADLMWSYDGTTGTDFVGRFPAGTMIAPGAVITVGNVGYEAEYNKCPNFVLGLAPLVCANGTAPILLQPKANCMTAMSNLSNAREMLVLFTWTGNAADLMQDIDYVVWGDPKTDPGASMDKTGQLTYKPDTKCEGSSDPNPNPPPVCDQKPAVAPMNGQSIERCGTGETSEKTTGGNGATGHDETSEDMAMTFVLQMTPSPGVKNACL